MTRSYKLINFSEMVEKSLCTLERIEAIISDCTGSITGKNVDSYGSPEQVKEAAVITFRQTVSN